LFREGAKITAVFRRGPARQVVQYPAVECRTCIPNEPISVPENSSDSGEPFPGPELNTMPPRDPDEDEEDEDEEDRADEPPVVREPDED
jgi:hypothetical protein